MNQARVSRSFRPFFTIAIPGLVLAVLFSGCSGSVYFGQKSLPIVTVSANPTSVAGGGSSTLTVAATNATSVTIAGSDSSSYTLPATGGTQTVTPSVTTTYTVTATGPGGSATASATVTVTGPAGPTVSISASPKSVTLGGSSTLTVVAANASAVIITGSDNTTYTVSASGGTQSVTPSATTTYTATATGAAGTTAAKAMATVTVNIPQPAITSFTANPTTITTSGGASLLTVIAANATAVTITGSDNSSYTLGATGGTQSVTPSATTVYTATATGPAGTTPAVQKLTVTVSIPQPAISSFTANPTTIAIYGGSSVLTVTAANATTVTITGGPSPVTLPIPSGTATLTVSPTATTPYTATANGAAGTTPAVATATVTVAYTTPAPTITVTPAATTIQAGAGPVTLTVTAANATTVTLTGSDNTSYPMTTTGGTANVSPAAAATTTITTYTATATGPGGVTKATATVTVTANPAPTVTITAYPSTAINVGGSTTLYITATNATGVTLADGSGHAYTLTQVNTTYEVTVSPTTTTKYTATAAPEAGQTAATASQTITVGSVASVQDIKHVIFMLQENHTFDNYFGMLNPYRENTLDTLPDGTTHPWNVADDGNTYNVDGIDDKLTTITNNSDPNTPTTAYPNGVTYPLFKLQSTCIDDDSSDWLASFGDIYRWSTTSSRPINLDGFVHDAAGYANSCNAGTGCSGVFTDTLGARAMGYYDQDYLNYYYYMASQFAVSDRWFSPVASKSVDNRIATISGGTTNGLVKDPSSDDHLSGQLTNKTIFKALTNAGVSWKIYYTVTQGYCLADGDECTANGGTGYEQYPATFFENFQDSYKYIRENGSGNPAICTAAGLKPSSVAPYNDTLNSYCIDPRYIAPLSVYYSDLTAGTLPQFAFIEPGYGNNDEHPGSGQSVLQGQAQVASILSAFMETSASTNPASNYWSNSVFFLAYDEGGGPYDHVPPIPGESNKNTNFADMGTPTPTILDIDANNGVSNHGIDVNPDGDWPCPAPGGVATWTCDLSNGDPGYTGPDVVTQEGFAAQLGFRVPNFVISPFAKRHYVSHLPIDHTAIIKFVEERFITGNFSYLTARDAAQPVLDFFDFKNIPWQTPPAAPPSPKSDPSNALCTPGMHPMDGVAPF